MTYNDYFEELEHDVYSGGSVADAPKMIRVDTRFDRNHEPLVLEEDALD